MSQARNTPHYSSITGFDAPAKSWQRLVAVLAVVSSLLVVLLPTSPASAQVATDVVISEIFYNPDGQAEGHEFIELHNTSSSAIDIGGWQLTDGISYTFAPGTTLGGDTYLVLSRNIVDFQAVFGFAPTANFGGSLSNSGETITLRTSTAEIADQVTYDDVAPWPLSADGDDDSLVRIANGLAPNDPAAWIAGTPTPQLANDPNLTVLFSVQRGWYSSSQTVTLSSSIPGASITFNTSGNGAATQSYTGPITVNNNGDIRVIQAQANLAGETSALTTHTYVFKADAGVPVVATWPNGLAPAPGESEVTRSFEFIPPPSTGLTPAWGNAGVKASAGGVAAGESDKLFFRGSYGNSTLTGDLFGDNYYGVEPTTDIDQLFLRNNQGDGTHLRQIFAHDALLEMGQLSPHGRFVEYYKAGTDEGVRHMQERPEGGFMESYTGINKDAWRAWSTNETTPGSGTSNGLGNATLGAPYATWADAEAAVNVESMLDYLLVQWQAKVSDYRNIKNFRIAGPNDFNLASNDGQGADYRFHFFNWDMDLGYANNQYNRGHTSDWGWAGYTSPDYIAHEMDQFLEFRLLASDRIACAHFDNGPLSAAAFAPRLEARRQELVNAGGANQASYVNSLATWIDGRNTWLLNEFRSPGADRTVFGSYRPNRAPWKPDTNFTGPLLQADASVGVSVVDGVLSITNPNGGQVYYRTDGGDPRNPDGSLSPNAVAYSGPVGLLAGRYEIIARSFDSTDSDTFQAWSPACNDASVIDVAVTGNPGASPGEGLVINELAYNPVGFSNENGALFEFIEIFNTTSSAINASGFSFSDGVDFTFPPNTVIGAGEYFTVVSTGQVAHFAEYGVDPDGTYTGRLDDGGETVTLIDAVGGLIDTVTYDDVTPWPTTPDNGGTTLSLKEPTLDNALAASWGPSRSIGTPSAPNDTGPTGDVDCDGVLTISDALFIAQYTVSTRSASPQCPLADPTFELFAFGGDMDSNGVTDIGDALLIAQCTVGVDNGFCG